MKVDSIVIAKFILLFLISLLGIKYFLGSMAAKLEYEKRYHAQVMENLDMRLEVARLKLQMESIITGTELNNELVNANTQRYYKMTKSQGQHFAEFNRIQDKVVKLARL